MVPHIDHRAVVCLRAVHVVRGWRSCSRINRRTRSFEVLMAVQSFSVALAIKRRGFKHLANVGHKNILLRAVFRSAITKPEGEQPGLSRGHPERCG